MTLESLETPCLLLDRAVMEANARRFLDIAKRHGVTLRPHLKTAKSIEVARRVTDSEAGAPITAVEFEALHAAETPQVTLHIKSGPMTFPGQQLVNMGVFGLVVGSFLNVVIHRLPLGESVVSPRSRVCERTSRPFIFGSMMSRITRSGASSVAERRPAARWRAAWRSGR